MSSLKKILNKPIFWIGILSIPAIWALLVPGFYGASDDLHIAWLHQMDKVLKLWQIPPRFVPDLSFGFGYPLFNFVFPLPFYFAEIFHILGFNLVDSIKILFLLSIPLSGIAMYLLLREFSGRSLSLAGAILYIYTPYRAVDLYIRGAIGEIVSFIFLPLVALSFIKLAKSFSTRWIGIGSITLASLVLSHNITAYMFLPFILLLIISQLIFNSFDKRYLRNVFLVIFLALLISCYFWLPAILESSLVKYDTVFNFADHFPTIKQLFTPYWGYGASVPGPYDGMSFFLGIVNIFIIISALLFTALSFKKIKGMEKIIIIWSGIGILLSIFLMNYRSSFIWSSLPLLPYFQFPWRFLTMTTFFIPILLISFKYTKVNNIALSFLVIVIISTSWSYFRPQDFLGRKDGYYLNRYIPVPKASDEYMKTQEEYLRLPKDTKRRPDANYPIVFPASSALIGVTKINDLHFFINFSSEKEVSLNINKYFFPGWQAKLDNRKVNINPGVPFGQINILVPKGSHKLEVYFSETLPKRILDFASLAGFLVSLGLALKFKFRKYHVKK